MEARGLQDVLTHQQGEERERALRALLMRPLMSAGDPELELVRRHAEYLREWFARETGWNLQVERQCARLYKRPATFEDATRGLAEFDRDRYVLLCLACAVLERAESQITLRALGERLLEAAADPDLAARGFTYTLEGARERRSLVSICRLLLEFGVLGRVAGDEEAYVNQSGDVLYDVHRRVLARLPAGTRGASLVAITQPDLDFDGRLAALAEEYVPDTPDGRRTALRHRLARRLLDDPVLYHDELMADERDYLANQRGPLAYRLAQAAGLTAELRAEGLALVDVDGELSDKHLPAVGTEAHATLLVAEYLARAAQTDRHTIHSLHELASHLRSAADRYGRFWRKDAREAGAEVELAAEAVRRLEALRLIQRVENGVQPLPALQRYAISEAQA
ncbi:MAG TPA: TIGR02678 family protein [Steroidobacteraceae bacterium]